MSREETTVKIDLALSDEDINACHPIIRELRPGIARDDFLARVRAQEAAGYHMALARDNDTIVAVAGFRISENLAWGRHLYIDDLVTATDKRSMGYGSALLEWLRHYGIKHGCHQLHLDSGMQREQAHRFYEREGLSKAGYHFVQSLK